MGIICVYEIKVTGTIAFADTAFDVVSANDIANVVASAIATTISTTVAIPLLLVLPLKLPLKYHGYCRCF